MLASEKSGPRLPSEQPAAAMVAAAPNYGGSSSSYGASRSYGGARAASRARAAKAPAGAISAAAAIAAAAIIAAAGCSDGNLGPDFSDANIRQRIPTNPLKKSQFGDTKGFHS